MNNKGVDQNAQIYRLVCAFLFPKTKTGILTTRHIQGNSLYICLNDFYKVKIRCILFAVLPLLFIFLHCDFAYVFSLSFNVSVFLFDFQIHFSYLLTRPCSAFSNVSGYRCVPDCKSRGHELDPSPVQDFPGHWSLHLFLVILNQEGLLQAKICARSTCLPLVQACPGKSVVRLTDCPAITKAVDFYGDSVYKLKKIVGSNNFPAQFIKIISHYKKIGYNINVLQQTACLVVNPIKVNNFAFLFNCTQLGRSSDSMMIPT